MAYRRKAPTTRQSKRVSRAMNDSTIGTHVTRGAHSSRRSGMSGRGSSSSYQQGGRDRGRTLASSGAVRSGESSYRGNLKRHHYIETVQHRARNRRIGLVAVVVAIVVAIAVLVGFLVFRGMVGSEMALKDSDASSALVAVHADEPYYALITAELGAVAQPLQHNGPDVLILARVDRQQKTLSLVNVPAGLQVLSEGGTARIGDLAAAGDAALIAGVSNFAKVDISHLVKLEEGGIEGIVDALGGIDVNLEQEIDDPQAGDVYLPEGTYTLNGPAAITYLRAKNVRLGVTDQLDHQVKFAALVLNKLCASEGSFATRIEAIDSYFQTDLSLGDIESVQGWLKDLPVSSITTVSVPGYLTEVTGVSGGDDELFVGSADSMAAIISALENGTAPDISTSTDVAPADPSSFTVEVQNGTTINGAASITADSLAAAGFNVAKVGNAEQPVYEETLVVYNSAGGVGPSRAKAVINALGIGRAVSGDMYYTLETDVLLIVGSDYKPFV